MTRQITSFRSFVLLLFMTCGLLASGSAGQGNILLTGHDTLLHRGQAGYDRVILDYLRDTSEAAGTYTIGIIGSNTDTGGSWGFNGGTGTTNMPFGGYLAANVTYYDTINLDGNTALQDAAVANDVLIINAHTSCGGCDLSDDGSAIINGQMAARIVNRFNLGMDLFVDTGANLLSFYSFLPSDFVATSLPISGSTFCATPTGTANGVLPQHTTGYPTHNKFPTYSSLLAVWETDCPAIGPNVITLAARDIIIPPKVVYVNKDLLNSTGLLADDVEILIEGTFTSTLYTVNGGFPNFTITPVGQNTQFRWSGLATPSGTVRHVGFGVNADKVHILGVFWTLGGSVVGCAPQCNTLYGTHSSGTGVLSYQNNVTNCSAQTQYAGNLQVEYYDANVPELADMVVGGARNPIRIDSVPGIVMIPVNGTASVPAAPNPPAGAEFSLLVFDLGTDPGLTDATGDFILTRIERNVPDSDPLAGFCYPNAGGTRSCPCGNQPSPNNGTRGCNNFGTPPPSSGDGSSTGGAMLSASGAVVSNSTTTLVFHVTAQQGTASGNITILFMGSTTLSSGVISGAGVRCVSGLLIPRPYKGQSVNVGGGPPDSCEIDFPNGSLPPPYNQNAWTRSGSPAPGSVRHYYAAYRNTAAGTGHPPCGPAAAFNLTNAGTIVW